MADPTRPAGAPDSPPTSINTSTHWWDASQIYGTDARAAAVVRTGTGGKLRVEPDGLPPLPGDRRGDPSEEPGFWIGLAMLQTLFTLEHNAICDMLRGGVPGLDRRGDLPAGPADRRGADRQDPHGRVDAVGHRPPDHRDRDAGQLVRPGRASG